MDFYFYFHFEFPTFRKLVFSAATPVTKGDHKVEIPRDDLRYEEKCADMMTTGRNKQNNCLVGAGWCSRAGRRTAAQGSPVKSWPRSALATAAPH